MNDISLEQYRINLLLHAISELDIDTSGSMRLLEQRADEKIKELSGLERTLFTERVITTLYRMKTCSNVLGAIMHLLDYAPETEEDEIWREAVSQIEDAMSSLICAKETLEQ